MNTVSDKLFEPFHLPVSGIKLKNRIIMAPMTTWSGNEDGTVSNAEISYYKRRSSGVALVITACAYVIPQGKGFSGQIGVHDDAMIPSLMKIASTIHGNGALAILQIYHGGRMSPPEVIPDNQPLSA
ncbi:MAG: NADH-dependent flavin oxidoreductase, partial [Bacteroidota bacterium]|nr:NADH-dependent flavin oxidoreductase [Bacteroidota bacterium]